MADADEATIQSIWGATFTPDDADARMNALLWAGALPQANRAFATVSPLRRGIDGARLMALQGFDPYSAAAGVQSALLNADPGFLYARARELRKQGQGTLAQQLLANRPR
jgi:soluble lytic murein transglycosylase